MFRKHNIQCDANGFDLLSPCITPFAFWRNPAASLRDVHGFPDHQAGVTVTGVITNPEIELFDGESGTHRAA